MSIFEIVNSAISLLLAFGAAIAVVAALGLSMHGERLWSARFVPAIAPLILLGIAVSTLLSGRNLVFAERNRLELLSEPAGGGDTIMRLITLTILSVAIARLIGTFVRRQSLPTAPGTPLFIALLAYIVAANFLPSIFGTVPVFVHSMFYPLVIFAAAWAARRESLEATIRSAKAALYVLMVGSLIAALLVPAIAVQSNYQDGLVPGLEVRLWGLGFNPNSIGPLALVTLLMEYLQPTRSRWLRALLILATCMVFVFAQSKTVWVALLIVLTTLGWYQWAIHNRHQANSMPVLAMLVVGIVLLVTLIFADIGVVWDRFADSKAGSSVTTLTGRTAIWEVAIREWGRNPLFGYGPEIWGPKFRAEVGMSFAFSAHNQFLQTLSRAGVVGLIGLLIYFCYLIPAALRIASATRGVSLALFGMILLRCFSEAPLSMNGLIDAEVLIHFLLFVIVLRAPESGAPLRAEAILPFREAQCH